MARTTDLVSRLFFGSFAGFGNFSLQAWLRIGAECENSR